MRVAYAWACLRTTIPGGSGEAAADRGRSPVGVGGGRTGCAQGRQRFCTRWVMEALLGRSSARPRAWRASWIRTAWARRGFLTAISWNRAAHTKTTRLPGDAMRVGLLQAAARVMTSVVEDQGGEEGGAGLRLGVQDLLQRATRAVREVREDPLATRALQVARGPPQGTAQGPRLGRVLNANGIDGWGTPGGDPRRPEPSRPQPPRGGRPGFAPRTDSRPRDIGDSFRSRLARRVYPKRRASMPR